MSVFFTIDPRRIRVTLLFTYKSIEYNVGIKLALSKGGSKINALLSKN